MVLELQELGYQLVFKNFRCQRQVPRWTKKKGYSSSPSSSTPKSGRWLIISQTVLLGQIFLQLMLMGHFGQGLAIQVSIELLVGFKLQPKILWAYFYHFFINFASPNSYRTHSLLILRTLFDLLLQFVQALKSQSL